MLSRRALFLLSGTVFSVSQSPLAEAAILGSKRTASIVRPVNAFYVSPSGNDSNNGRSPQTAWQTIAKVNAGVYRAGTQILFQGGQMFTGSVTLRSENYSMIAPPTVSNPLAIGSYGNGRATINVTAANGRCFNLTNLGNLVVQNLILTGSGAGGSQGGISCYNTTTSRQFSNVTFAHLDISGVNVGVDMATIGDSAHGFSNVLFSGLNVHNLAATASPGIFIAGFWNGTSYNTTSAVYAHQNVTITNCTVSGAGTDGLDLWNVNGALVQFCRFTANGTTSPGSGANACMETQASTNVTIQFCEFDHQIFAAGATDDGNGINIDRGSSNITAQYNWVHDNAGAGITVFQGGSGTIPMSNIIVRYNITQNNGTAGASTNVPCEIVLGAYGQIAISGISIYNNTFYASKNGTNVNAIVLFAAANVTGNFANNILYGTANLRSINAPSLNPSTMNFTGNCYFGTTKINWNGTNYTTVATWQAATGQERIAGVDVSLTSDPKLTNPGGGRTTNGYDPRSLTAYQLQHGSPLIGAGLNLEARFRVSPSSWDYYGDPIPNRRVRTGYNIGADGAYR